MHPNFTAVRQQVDCSSARLFHFLMHFQLLKRGERVQGLPLSILTRGTSAWVDTGVYIKPLAEIQCCNIFGASLW